MDNQLPPPLPAILTPPALPQTPYLQCPPQSVPTTKLLHFTLIANAISTGVGGVIYVFFGLVMIVSADTDRAAVMLCSLMMVALAVGVTWYWIHCVKTLQTLRAYAEQLFYASVRK